MTKRVFIAVPSITPPDIIKNMRRRVRRLGFEPVFAVDVVQVESDEQKNFHAICEAMTSCDIMIANLTPFLGVEPDPDVIFQLGYMAAQNKSVHSYTNVSKPFYERVLDWNENPFICKEQTSASDNPTLSNYDRNGMRIENMGIKNHEIDPENSGLDSYHNLMLEGPSIMSDTAVLTPQLCGFSDIPEAELYSDTVVFNRVCQQIKHRLQMEQKPSSAYPENIESSNAAYLAGPGVFLPDFNSYFTRAKECANSFHLIGVSPNDATMNFGPIQAMALPNGNNPLLRRGLYEARLGIMKMTRIGVFNLTPYHGVAAESGTIFDMGYMTGKNKALGREPMVFGFSNSPDTLEQRIKNWHQRPFGPSYGSEIAIKTTCNIVYSLMIDGAILASGGFLDHRPSSLVANACDLKGVETYSNLRTFEACVANTCLNIQEKQGPGTSRYSIWSTPPVDSTCNPKQRLGARVC